MTVENILPSTLHRLRESDKDEFGSELKVKNLGRQVLPPSIVESNRAVLTARDEQVTRW